jgi:hypothetical protein
MKFRFYYNLIFLIFLSLACENNVIKTQDQRVLTTNNSATIDKVPSIYCNINDSALHFQQDTLYYNNLLYNGFVFSVYHSKDTAFVGSYLNGLEEGLHQKKYQNHKIAEIRYYKKGKKINTHFGFWENGKPKFSYHFMDGELEDTLKEWYKNGKLYKLFHYKNGYEDGSQKMWWENGVIRANYVVKNGRRYGLIGLKLCMNPGDSLKKTLP